MEASDWTDHVFATCPKHGRYVCMATRFGEFREFGCPKCAAERKAAQERAEAEKRLLQNRASAAIPKRFAEKTLAGYAAENPGQRTAKACCEEWLKDAAASIEAGRCIVMCGKPGTGKTHLACGIANAILPLGFTAVFTSASDIIRTVRASWGGAGSETKAIRDFAAPDLLIIDEVGAQTGTENERNILFAVLNARYEDMRPVIILSNLTPRELQGHIGERSFDRLRENGGRCLVFDWESHR